MTADDFAHRLREVSNRTFYRILERIYVSIRYRNLILKIIFHLLKVSPMDDYPIVIKTLPLTTDKLRITLCCNNSDSDVEDAIIKIKSVINEYT